MLGRAFRVTFAPEREWGAIARDRPAALGVLVGHVLPLAAIPAVAWMIGLAAFGNGNTTPAFAPADAGPWKCAMVAGPLRPE